MAVATTGTESLHYAATLPMTDFEDEMQVAAARACGAQYIVTRNVKDYARSPIRAVTPQGALDDLFGSPLAGPGRPPGAPSLSRR